jgi:predicted nucleic acid-binding protein
MIVSNSTPLINFAAIHRLDILEQLFGKFHFIPNTLSAVIPAQKICGNDMRTVRDETTELERCQIILS